MGGEDRVDPTDFGSITFQNELTVTYLEDIAGSAPSPASSVDSLMLTVGRWTSLTELLCCVTRMLHTRHRIIRHFITFIMKFWAFLLNPQWRGYACQITRLLIEEVHLGRVEPKAWPWPLFSKPHAWLASRPSPTVLLCMLEKSKKVDGSSTFEQAPRPCCPTMTPSCSSVVRWKVAET